MIILPIRTESVVRRTPTLNYILIGINAVCFLLLDEGLFGGAMTEFKQRYLFFRSDEPALHQFFTYQFLHADVMHLLGNMIFLWVFGNSVNAKMGNGPYLVFYLAGGVFAAWGYGWMNPGFSYLLGASGAVASITTAYLALFPRSRVTVFVWLFFFIHFIELPAMVIIGVKIIVWDNIVAPWLGQSEQIAHGAHLSGYFFGFAGALGMLLVRALPRDQFDILAVWKRWKQRRDFSAVMSDPAAAARAQHGSVARQVSYDPNERSEHDASIEKIADLRGQIAGALERGDVDEGVTLYEQLITDHPDQCMSERQQLEIARACYGSGRFEQAAAAFRRLVESYPQSVEVGNVGLLLGIIYARDLKKFDEAEPYLAGAMDALRDEERRAQCGEWLERVRAALGNSEVEATGE